jgi:hypothetical protein
MEYTDNKMIECYYPQCAYHDKEEPFCLLNACVATQKDIKKWNLIYWKDKLNEEYQHLIKEQK